MAGDFDKDRLSPGIVRPFYEVWDRLRGTRAAPARRDFGPEDFKFALPHMALVDVLRDGDADRPRFRWRLVGTALDARLGRRLTGLPVESTEDGVAASADEAYLTAARWMAPHHSRMRVRRGDGLRWRFERLVLPLSADGAAVDMLAVCVLFEGLGEAELLRGRSA